MADVTKYKAGQALTYVPTGQQVTVIHNSLESGGVNAKTAFVTVRLPQGFVLTIPVEVQNDYLAEAQPVKRPGVFDFLKKK